MYNVFLKNFYTIETKTLNVTNLIHLIIRAVNFFMLSLLIIYASYYSRLAGINFGIIVCCLSISSPLNCICGFIFWHEKLTAKMIIGTMVIVSGVAWVALSKGADSQSLSLDISDDDRSKYRFISLSLALFCGLLGTTRV